MGTKKSQQLNFQTQLSNLVVAYDAYHQATQRAYEAQQAAQEVERKTYAAYSVQQKAVLDKWKETRTFPLIEHVKLPDGRVAVLQDHSFTIWKLTEI